MGKGKSNRFCIFLMAAIVALAFVVLPGCSKVKEKAADAAEIALGALEKGAAIAGEATANWLGTTAGNVGKNFNETITERFAYLAISVNEIKRIEAKSEDGEGESDGEEVEEGIVRYTIEITINNSAPDNEKMYMHILLGDHYLVACDQDDYTYSLTPGSNAKGSFDLILPGKSKFTAYVELAEQDEISYLLFIGNKISLPAGR